MTKKKSVVMIFVLVGLIIILSACGVKKLDGDYTGKINLLFTEGTTTLRFKGDKVTEVDDDGNETNEGTYEITDNELVITHSNEDISISELSKDKKSFTIKSADGVAGAFIKDITFTKKEK